MSRVTYKVSGRGAQGGPAKKMLILSAAIFLDGKEPPNPTKEDLIAHIEGPDTNIKVTIMGGTKGSYHVGFTPAEPGQYWLDFVFRGIWADEPYLVPATNATGVVPDFPYEGTLRKEAGAGSGSGSGSNADKEAEEERLRKEEEERERQAEEERKAEADRKAGAERKAEADRKAEAERKKKEEEEANKEQLRKKKEEDDKKKQEEEEEENRKSKEEDKKKEEAKTQAEQDRKKKEEDDKKKQAEQDKKKKEEEDKKKQESEKVKATEEKPAPKAQSTPDEDEDLNPDTEAYAGHVFAMVFMFRALNKHGKPCAPEVKAEFKAIANGEEVPEIENMDDGFYCFDYNSIPGENEIDVKFRDESVPGFPLKFTRKTEAEIEEEAAQLREEEERKAREEEERKAREEEERKEKERKQKEEEEAKKKTALASKKTATPQTDAEKKKKLEEKKAELAAKKKAELAAKKKAAGDSDKPEEPSLPSARALLWEQKLQKGEETKTSKTKVELPQGTGASKLSSVWEQRLQGKEVEGDDKPPVSPRKDSTPSSRGTFAQRFLQAAQAEKKEDDESPSKKVELPSGTGATKVAALWQTRLQGGLEDENKVEKTTVDLPEGTGASKLASVWQKKLEGKDEEENTPRKTAVELPQGTGASKLSAVWESKLKGEEESTKTPPVEKAKPAGTPSKLAQMWENKALETEDPKKPAAKDDIEELKAMMAKERESLLKGETSKSEESEAPSATEDGSAEPSDIFDPDSLEILVKLLNDRLELAGDKLAHELPLSASDDLLFEILSDGISMCHFFDQMLPSVLDTSAIIADAKDTKDKIENWNLCLTSARGNDCKLDDVKAADLAEGDREQIQKVIWQISKVGLETEVKMAEDYIKTVLPDIDAEEDILLWPIDKLLLNWVNALVKKNGHDKEATSIANDFKDSFLYIVLLDDVCATGAELLEETDLDVRALEVVEFSNNLDRGPVITAQGIVDGVYWQNFIFLCSIFLTASIL